MFVDEVLKFKKINQIFATQSMMSAESADTSYRCSIHIKLLGLYILIYPLFLSV